MAKMTEAEMDAHIDQALARAKNEPADETPVADLVEFDLKQRLLLILLSNGRRLVIPLEDIQGLGEATREQLEDYDLHGNGFGIDWPSLNVSYRIGGLLDGLYGNQLWMQQLMKKRGASRSEAKQQAARANGAKGGRPKKVKVAQNAEAPA